MPAPSELVSLDQLSFTQRQLGIAALRGQGDLCVGYRPNLVGGFTWNALPDVGPEAYANLVKQFRRDPVGVQRTFRDNMLAVATDERLDPELRNRGLDRYIDASIDLILRLDHDAFPPTPEGDVYTKPPLYLPDGFVNMGNSEYFTPRYRNHEIVVVDKRRVLDRYKPQIKEALLSIGMAPMTGEERDLSLLNAIGLIVYEDMPYSRALANNFRSLGYGKLNLSEIEEYVCRHQALVAQILLQTLGVTFGMVKSRVLFPGAKDPEGESHMNNLAKIGDKWYIVDITNPDFTVDSNGTRQWNLALAPLPQPSEGVGLDAVYNVSTVVTGQKRRYELRHSSLRWYIQSPEHG